MLRVYTYIQHESIKDIHNSKGINYEYDIISILSEKIVI